MSDEPIEGYCVKCRQKRPIASAQAVFLGGQGRPATRGVCPECGTAMTRFGATPAHDGLAPPVHTPTGAVGSAQTASKKAGGRGKAKRRASVETTPEQRAAGPKMVVVESPAKARTVGRFLGRGYTVEASIGHIRDLPERQMGVDIEGGFVPRYVIPVAKKEVVDRLRAKAQQASELYLATDPDREGEAIAWHLATALERQVRGIPVHRVEFHEITQEAIGNAFANPREIDQSRVDAQQARRILDRVVGYTLSPLLREKLGRRNLSAGRVQSVALRLICEREREIQAFVPVEYWTIEAELCKLRAGGRTGQEADGAARSSDTFVAKLIKIRNKDPDLKNQADAQSIVDDLTGAVYVVHKVTRQERRRYPSPPFMTSTLQAEASRKLGYTAKRTMAIAQALYEGKDIGGGERVGLITYMRTDSLNVAASAQAEARQFIQNHYGPSYLPAKTPYYRSPKTAQEAHEAIRPTGVRREPDSLKPYLTRDELQLYSLIWRRFVASQMAPAILDQTVVDVLAGREGEEKPYLFRAVGSVVKFPGFLRVYEDSRKEGEKEEGEGVKLPDLEQGERLRLIRLLPKQHFTQPPPRYTDASLIRALEEFGIGRPSTYAPILSTLLERQYVERVNKQLIPTEIGFVVNDRLVGFFPNLVNVAFTAEMEEKLDRIAVGERAWVPMLHEFYEPFAQTVTEARVNMPRTELKPEPTGELCPQCGKPLVIRRGRYGKFIGCSGWPGCRYVAQTPLPGVSCPQCGGPVYEKRTKRGRRFYACANYRPNDETACNWASSRLPKGAKAPDSSRLAGPSKPSDTGENHATHETA